MEGTHTRRRLGDLLVDEGVLSHAQVSELLQARIQVDGRMERLGEAAVRLGFATVDEIGMVLARQLDLEYLAAQALMIDPELARRVPAALVERHMVVPLHREDDVVVVACADPTNIIGLDDVRVAVGARRLKVVVAPLQSLRQAIGDSFGLEFGSTAEGLVEALEIEEALPDELLADAATDGPIIRLADEIITTAVRARASDVHIEPKTDRCIVRHRIDRVLHEAMSLPRSVGSPLISRIKLIAGLDIAERRKPQDGRSHFRGAPNRPEEAVDLRLSTLPRHDRGVAGDADPATRRQPRHRRPDGTGRPADRRRAGCGRAPPGPGPGDRAHGVGQDLDAVRPAGAPGHGRAQADHRGGPGRVRAG